MTDPKTRISAEQVRKLGDLAKISMTASEEQSLRSDLSSILDYFRVIDMVPDDVALDQPSDDATNLRRDEVRPSDPDGILGGVPRRKGRFVKAPRVF